MEMDRVITSPSLPSFFSPPPCFWYLVANGNNRETTFPPILNGSGIAAISTTYGNKHLFFQDETSAIRTSILIDDTWLNSNAWSGVEKARLQTPLQTVGYVWNDREYVSLCSLSLHAYQYCYQIRRLRGFELTDRSILYNPNKQSGKTILFKIR